MADKYIEIRGARHHNLKDIDLSIPLGKIVAITGPSGSGKSTLAIDILFAEGQHRYIESLGTSARRFIDLWDRPQVESIKNIPPAIALEQKGIVKNPNSTVATLTDVASLLRILFATNGTAFCPTCKLPVYAMTIDQMANQVIALPEKTKITIMAPMSSLLGTVSPKDLIEMIREQGFLRIKLNESVQLLDSYSLPDEPVTSLEVIIDRIVLKEGILQRLMDSLGLALKIGNGSAAIEIHSSHTGKEPEILIFNEALKCSRCATKFPELRPQLFSGKDPEGACPFCGGVGKMPSSTKSCPHCKGSGLNAFVRGISIKSSTYPGIIDGTIEELVHFLNDVFFPKDTSTPEPIRNQAAGATIAEAILSRLSPIKEMGLGYMALSRSIDTLSGGEIQRLRIGTQLGRNLTGVLYILDEPTLGLHPREYAGLLRQIEKLKGQGNSVLLVEHDLGIIRLVDHVIELGPGAGVNGGEIIYSGPPDKMETNPRCITGMFMSGTRTINRPGFAPKGKLTLRGASKNNLKDVSVEIPLGCLVCITGVSGSGKTTLLMEELVPAIEQLQGLKKRKTPHHCAEITVSFGQPWDFFTVVVDQAPILGRKSSLPVTYLGIFDRIRDLMARTPEARQRGYKKTYFSLNHKGGRCEYCKGLGRIYLDLDYLPPVEQICQVCNGARFNQDVLAIQFKGQSISDILEMTVSEAANFFSKIPSIRSPLEILERTGLGYLKLGRPTSTLSGGEIQRLKLSKELSSPPKGHTLYLMDEPSQGLHLCDLEKIVAQWDELIDNGHSVIIIDHRRELLENADWIIEMGPGGGPEGGQVIFQGSPTMLQKNPGDIFPR